MITKDLIDIAKYYSVNPRTSLALSLLIVTGYFSILALTEDEQFLSQIFVSAVGSMLFIIISLGAFSFASEEVKSTAGVSDLNELSFGRMVSLFMFSILVSIGFVTLFVVSIEVFNEASSSVLSRFLIFISIGFLLVYPLFEFYSLSKEGEDSAIPAEFVIETFMEALAKKVHSRIIATLLAYFLLYLLPIVLLIKFLDTSLITALLLWAIMLPMINLGALAGSGLGEDLLTLKLVRKKNFANDFFKLGWPKIKFKDEKGNFRMIPQFELGGAFLVLFAVQALLTTAYFVYNNITDIIQLSTVGFLSTGVGLGFVFVLSLLNKGRGALKEMLAVWNESGFKVSALSLFLPVFVLFGVVIASILEVYANLPIELQQINVLGAYGLNRHPRLVLIFLIVQNLILLVSATIILVDPPGLVERRLVWELPKLYDDVEGWLEFYQKIKSEKALVAMLELARKKVSKDISSHVILKTILEETLNSPYEAVRIAASQALLSVVKGLQNEDNEYYQMIIDALEDKSHGVRLFALRSLRYYFRFFKENKVLEGLNLIISKIYDPEVSVAWEANRTLQYLMKDRPKMKSAVLSYIIRAMTRRSGEETEQIFHFINQATRDFSDVGTILLSTFLEALNQPDLTSKQKTVLIEGIRQVLRANPSLSTNLLDMLHTFYQTSDVTRKRTATKILANLAAFHTGKEGELATLLTDALQENDLMIRSEALKGFSYIVKTYPAVSPILISYAKSILDDIEGNQELLIPMTEVVEQFIRTSTDYDKESFEFLSAVLKKIKNEKIQENVLRAFVPLAMHKNSPFADDLYFIAETTLEKGSTLQKEIALEILNELANVNPEMGRAIYRLVIDHVDSPNDIIQIKVIETLGAIGKHNRTLVDDVLNTLSPLTESPKWHVRLSAFDAYFQSVLNQPHRLKDSIPMLKKGLNDQDGHVREVSLDFANKLLEKQRAYAKELFDIGKKLIKNKSPQIRQTGIHLMGTISERNLTLIDEVLKVIPPVIEEEDYGSRAVAKQVIRLSMEKIATLKTIPADIVKALDKIVTASLKAANHSHASVRRDAYELWAIIAESIPQHPISDRIRKAIERAQKKQEKDPALLEFLEECRIRAKPPVFYVKEDGKIKI